MSIHFLVYYDNLYTITYNKNNSVKRDGSVGIGFIVKRNSNIELLRLIAMAFITVHHFAIWGYFIGNEVHTVQQNTVWLQFLEFFGKVWGGLVHFDHWLLCP